MPYTVKITEGGVFALLQRILHLSKRNNGGILIEFTFSIPVCISLLFFVNDHYRFYELKSKIRTSAYLAASMLQQLGNTRTDKQLSINDICRIAFASCLNLFHTNVMFKPHPFGIYYLAYFYYVKRISSDNYQYQTFWTTTGNSGLDSNILTDRTNKSVGKIAKRSQLQIEAIHPDLVCQNDGEERLLIECWYNKVSGFSKSKLGLFILEPNFGTAGIANRNGRGNFSYSLVITSKPALFPVKNT